MKATLITATFMENSLGPFCAGELLQPHAPQRREGHAHARQVTAIDDIQPLL